MAIDNSSKMLFRVLGGNVMKIGYLARCTWMTKKDPEQEEQYWKSEKTMLFHRGTGAPLFVNVGCIVLLESLEM